MKNPTFLTSKTNPTVKEFCRMAKKPDGEFFLVEGKNFVFDLDKKLLKAVLITGDGVFEKEKEEFIKENVPVYIITDQISEKISSTQNPQEIMAFSSKQDVKMPDRILILEKTQDPGNMGTMIRSAVAFGFGVIYSDECANPFLTKVVRSSAGTLQKCFLKKGDIKEEIKALKNAGFTVYSSELDKKAKTPDEISKTEKVAFVVGNESTGISEETSKLCDGKVFIPIKSGAESLNAAAAASILMYDFRK